ncbi:endonuclease [Bacteroidales bacterium OttesenSCG-928-I21]|nr:endonuclease [Bacteroidales bacterium OttesenSCG-928-I21]
MATKRIINAFLLVVFIFFYEVCFCQIPDGYYDGTEGLRGENLRSVLFNIISGHTSLSYGDLWEAFEDTDKKANGKVWDMYSDNPNGTPPYEYTFVTDQCGNYGGEAICYNREHSFPKSWFNDASPMYTDLFHLYPTDGYVNGRRSNYPYGEVGNTTWTSRNGSKLGTSNYSGYSGVVFEPIDEYKGDFARTYFYMLTRYKDKISTWTCDMLSGNNFATWAKQMLLEWHRNDPVSQKEIDRNNAVYSYQRNRNPFIDNPEFADKIWDADYPNNPELIVTSPTTGITVNENYIDIEFYTVNFTVGTDGKIEYKLNNGNSHYSVANVIRINNLIYGTNTISLQLVDNNNNAINPIVIKNLQVFYNSESNGISITNSSGFEIFPNPVSATLNIKFDNNNTETKSVYILNIVGEEILSTEFFDDNYTINISGNKSGIYFILIRLNSGEVYTEKIVVL